MSDDWRDDAACHGRRTNWWFSSDALDVAVAVAVCRGCPVRSPCLADALVEERHVPPGDVYGIRGGLAPRARVALARRQVVPVPEPVVRVRPASTGRVAWPGRPYAVAL